MTQNSISYLQDYLKNLKDDNTNLHYLNMLINEGLIDKDKYLEFDIDKFYSKVLHTKNKKEQEMHDRMQEFKERSYDRHQKKKLPFS